MSGEKMKTAKAGEEITARAAAKLKKTTPFMAHVLSTKEGCTVAPKSTGQHGQWICIDCGETFQNNMGAHGHTKSHRRAWWNGERFEEP